LGEYDEKSYQYYVTYHDGWRRDGSVDVMAAKCYYGDDAVPLIQHNGQIYDYAGFAKAMGIDAKHKECNNGSCRI